MSKNLTKKDIAKLQQLAGKGNIPRHIAIIMDGNGRWAKRRGLPRAAGHKRGVETVRKVVEACSEMNVGFLTLYTFSTENWRRPADEVSTLMRLMVKSLRDELDELDKNNVKLTAIGNLNTLPVEVKKELEEAMHKTCNNSKLVLNLALSYSGRLEMVDTIKQIAEKYKHGNFSLSEINEEFISKHLYTKDMPDPDLMIRSGGEMRISNFLLWQLAYSEIFITDVLWPNFDVDDLIRAISDFQTRERRFGMVSEQISENI